MAHDVSTIKLQRDGENNILVCNLKCIPRGYLSTIYLLTVDNFIILYAVTLGCVY